MSHERSMARQLLVYYDREGRKLPWRGEKDLYRIWLAEIMLQQTGVATVIPYYQRFLERFPHIASLAQADFAEVLTFWQGMGYYRRARMLHQAVGLVQEKMGGDIPRDFEILVKLPGIGPSTAAAILAIGCNQWQTILDGNVKRVLARITGLTKPLASSAAKKLLWEKAESLTPRDRPGDYAQAIMDLGAMVCRPRQPKCDSCPWQPRCLAFASGQPEAFPVREIKEAKPKFFQVAILLHRDDGSLLFHQRPPDGLLGGMWEPLSGPRIRPSFAIDSAVEVDGMLAAQWALHGEASRYFGEVNHVFTHFHLTVAVYGCRYLSGKPEDGEFRWLSREDIDALPMATLHRKILQKGGFI